MIYLIDFKSWRDMNVQSMPVSADKSSFVCSVYCTPFLLISHSIVYGQHISGYAEMMDTQAL